MSPDIPAFPEEARIKERTAAVMGSVSEVMFGMERVTELCLIALYCGGHVLLEGNPGLGKTKLVRTLEKTLRLPYKRIQFTPDLMPTDITGSEMPSVEERRRLEFRCGPIFTSLLLADEINRASPKTQAAMLEAMAEKEVTVQGNTYPLEEPFMVLATQNPIDHEGTYPLPEAQADRFMFKIMMPYPGETTLRRIIAGSTGPLQAGEAHRALNPREVEAARGDYRHFHENIRRVRLTRSVETHIVNLLLATNGSHDALVGLSKTQKRTLRELVDTLVVFGFGPRAAENLSLAAKAYALMFLEGRDGMAGPEALAQIAVPVLRHRLKLVFDWEEEYGKIRNLKLSDTERRDGLMTAMLAELLLAAAPDRDKDLYGRSIQQVLAKLVPKHWVVRGGLW